MSSRFRVACIQINASSDLEANLAKAVRLFKKAIAAKAQLIAFPENFSWRGASSELPHIASQSQRIIRFFQDIACQHKVCVLLGSILEGKSASAKVWNTSILILPSGKIGALYRKIHLFEIGLRNLKTDESRHVARGSKPTLGKIGSLGVGLSICYDLRFPELFRRLVYKGAKVFFVPANFTAQTGKAHWETLLRARAIENQSFVIAPAQVGISPSNGIESYGHSLIVDPWGKVLASGDRKREGVVAADLDFLMQRRLRKEFPVLRHAVLIKSSKKL